MTKPKTLEQLRAEKERAETQLAQEKHSLIIYQPPGSNPRWYFYARRRKQPEYSGCCYIAISHILLFR